MPGKVPPKGKAGAMPAKGAVPPKGVAGKPAVDNAKGKKEDMKEKMARLRGLSKKK